MAGAALLVAVTSGLERIGKPLRLVNVLTLVPLGVIAGLALGQAIRLVRGRGRDSGDGGAA